MRKKIGKIAWISIFSQPPGLNQQKWGALKGTIALIEKSRVLRDFSNGDKKHKNGKPFMVTFLCFLSPFEKIQKAAFSINAIVPERAAHPLS